MKSQLPGYYDATEAAAVIGCCYSALTRYVRAGLLPARRLGRRIVIEQAAVHDFVPPRDEKTNGHKT